ncbi:MAG: porin family protein [Bradyrhizobium sp.]|uniref:outer membrane protein n=1 Tax=Bradyrhizobium sp. TaxID=376 RepID=UPI0025C1F044|nr:outer membrane protein [Bradyrhizobium sp.]MBI5264915.1 porin family protein [Bradyrhizobium sp.]
MRQARTILPIAAAIASISFAGAASAADLAPRYTKAPPAAVVALYDWTGFYVGAQVGYDWRRDSNVERFIATGLPDGWTASSDPSGIVGGLHAGYNIQSGKFVFGLEGDIEAADIKGTGFYRFNGGPAITDHIDSRTRWQGSFRGRLGLAANNWLLYATGGLTFADFEHVYVSGVAGPPITSFSTTRAGWTVGAGVEYGFTTNWRARVEYRYSDYGTITNNVGAQFAGGLQDQRITDNSVRVGVSYHWGGPVVARY